MFLPPDTSDSKVGMNTWPPHCLAWSFHVHENGNSSCTMPFMNTIAKHVFKQWMWSIWIPCITISIILGTISWGRLFGHHSICRQQVDWYPLLAKEMSLKIFQSSKIDNEILLQLCEAVCMLSNGCKWDMVGINLEIVEMFLFNRKHSSV